MPERPPPDSRATVPLGTPAYVRDAAVELSSSDLLEDASVIPPEAVERQIVGTTISGRYRVDTLIGKGGMGAVYRGEQVRLKKRVAIKVLRPDAERLPEIVARFEHEAVAGAHVSHPNVASAIDFGRLEDSSWFLVLEYVDGAPLKEAMAGGPMPALRALRIARQVAAALVAVHGKGIVHRDLKPQNLLLAEGDRVKLIDFGLAKVRVDLLSKETREVTRPDHQLTVAGVVFGTIAYLAPEAALGMDAVDARSDLYALGIIVYEMLSGRHPFDATEAVSLFRHQRFEDPPPVRLRAPEVPIPAEAEAVVMKLIQRNPAERYATAADAVAAIDAAIASLEGSHAAPTAPPPAATKSPLLFVAIAALVLLVLAGAAIALID